MPTLPCGLMLRTMSKMHSQPVRVYPVPGTGVENILSLCHRGGWHSLLLPLRQPFQNIYSLRCLVRTVKSPALAVFVLMENAKPVTEAAFKAFTLRTKA